MSAIEVIQELRPKVSQIPGINVFMQIPPTIRIGGSLTKSQYQYTLQSPDTKELYQDAPKLEAALRALPQLQDVTSDLQVKNPQLTVEVDHDKAYALDVDAGRRFPMPSTPPTERARSAPSTRPTTSTTSSWNCCRNSRTFPTNFRCFTSAPAAAS